MANIQSQIKRNRQNETLRRRNKGVRTALKNRMKRFDAAADTGDRDTAVAAYREAARRLDKAAGKGVVHANYAANRKSQMARRLRQLS